MAYGQQGLGQLSTVRKNNIEAAEHFRNAARVFGELKCVEKQCRSKLDMAKVLLAMEDYRTCSTILEEVEESDSRLSSQNWLIHLKGVLLLSTSKDNEAISIATAMIEQSIAGAGEIRPEEMVYMYSNFFKALEKGGKSDQADSVLKKSLQLLESELSNIETRSIRNSILSRADLQTFLDLCRTRGIASPLLNS